MMNIELQVTGMTCEGCANSVRRAITREFPNVSVHVELATGRVRVDGEIDSARAILSIKNAGFGIASPAP
jgi:copper chaperone